MVLLRRSTIKQQYGGRSRSADRFDARRPRAGGMNDCIAAGVGGALILSPASPRRAMAINRS
jgi:hypothetical protein